MSRNSWAAEYSNRSIPVAKFGVFSIERDTEGFFGVYFKGEYVTDLAGHQWEFHEQGILLSLKDQSKDVDESRSFIFYNNEGKKILDVHNRRYIKDPTTGRKSYIRPNKDIQVEVYKDCITIIEISLETQEENKYIIDILTGEKLNSLIDGDQFTLNI